MYELINALFRMYEIVILIRVVFSWIPTDRNNAVFRWVYKLTEPVLAPIRNMLPLERIGIDISPLVLLFAMWLIQQMLWKLIL